MWGDPDEGYVGRADGTGPVGGFAVYPRPVARAARRYGVRLDDLTGAAPRAIYDRLLAGRAVLAWVGLADGPYGSWQTPAGRRVRVNFNEHTVVLTGVRSDGSLQVVNVLHGTREICRHSSSRQASRCSASAPSPRPHRRERCEPDDLGFSRVRGRWCGAGSWGSSWVHTLWKKFRPKRSRNCCASMFSRNSSPVSTSTPIPTSTTPAVSWMAR